MPNEDKIDLSTKAASQPAEGALNSNVNALEQHGANAVSEVKTALTQALDSINQTELSTNSQALEEIRQQMSQAEEFLDQAQTSANALNLPDQK
ncbi:MULTISPECIES: hypothetical protein [Paenibacillus]|uniref:Uncharacterized protein n=1 Tax=Paenibacillus baimaensis TaxID=2982185 RepID=A0ABT2U9A5_9BACL|nr:MULTISPECIES: hypothetical protein [Paenibacillus]MCU6791218.1 hypothetical protein [Paenibacillus sp. WQ 127069]